MTIIAQVSDVHVRPLNALYQDLVDSNMMFARAVESLNQIDPPPDLVLISGDLTDEGTPGEYAALRTLLGRLEHPVVVLPGNHDDRANLRHAFADHTWLPRDGSLSFSMGLRDVRLIALDTSVPDFHYGELDTDTLAWLDEELSNHRDTRAVIAMHHPPFETGIPYLDIYGLRNTDAFAKVISRHENVDRILAGHVHRSMQTRIGNVPVMTCPSTTTQIALRLDVNAEPASYREPPAFMLHHWADMNTPGVSHLCYIGDYGESLPFA